MQVDETKKRTGRDLAGGVRATEIMVAAGARELRDSEVVIVGLGLPEITTVLAKRVIVIMRHEKRKLPMAVSHLTSPGLRRRQEPGGAWPARRRAFPRDHRYGRARIRSRDPFGHSALAASGVRLEEMLGNTGFPLQVPEQIPATPLPTPEQLRLLHEEIDPKGAHLK